MNRLRLSIRVFLSLVVVVLSLDSSPALCRFQKPSHDDVLIEGPDVSAQNILTPHATKVVSGAYFSCALLSDGSVKCWGKGYSGELGNGVDGESNIPVSVSGITDAVDLVAGDYHACILNGNHRVKCWGSDSGGQLGNGLNANGLNVNSNVPVLVSNITSATKLAAGSSHTCILNTVGNIKCWGKNDSGQLGSSGGSSNIPLLVSGVTSAVELSANKSVTCIVNGHNKVKCWGLGAGAVNAGVDDNLNDPYDPYDANYVTSDPTLVPNLFDAEEFLASTMPYCVRTTAGSVKCWYQVDAQCTNEIYEVFLVDDIPTFYDVKEIPALQDVEDVEVTYSEGSSMYNVTWYIQHTGGALQSCGEGSSGELGYGADADVNYPVSVQGAITPSSIAPGSSHVCTIDSATSNVQCWGAGGYGQLGNGNSINSNIPVDVQGL